MKKMEHKKLSAAVKLLKKSFRNDVEVQSACTLISERLLSIELDEPTAIEGYPIPQELLDHEAVALFSDGACRGNPGPGSWGYIIQERSGEITWEASDFSDLTTNNKMELSGAIYALKYLKDQGRNQEKVFLFTDSTYVVKGITEWVKGWKARGWKKADRKAPENLELWQQLDSLSSEFHDVHYRWVKGHSGHPQNERCDQLANEALDAAGY